MGGTGEDDWEALDVESPVLPKAMPFLDLGTAPAASASAATVLPKVVAKPPRVHSKKTRSRTVVAMFVTQTPQDKFHSLVLEKGQDLILAEIGRNDRVSSERRVVPSTSEGTDSALMRTFRDLLYAKKPAYCDSSVTLMKDEEARAYGCTHKTVVPQQTNVYYSQIDKIDNIALFTHDTFLAAAAAEYASAHATGRKQVTIIFDNSKGVDLFTSAPDSNANGKRAWAAVNKNKNVRVVQYRTTPVAYKLIGAINSFSDVATGKPLVMLFDNDGGGFRERAEAFIGQTPEGKRLLAARGGAEARPNAWLAPPQKPSGGGRKKKK